MGRCLLWILGAPDAVPEHAGKLGNLPGKIAAVPDPDLEIFGRASPQLVEAQSAFPVRYHGPLQPL